MLASWAVHGVNRPDTSDLSFEDPHSLPSCVLNSITVIVAGLTCLREDLRLSRS